PPPPPGAAAPCPGARLGAARRAAFPLARHALVPGEPVRARDPRSPRAHAHGPSRIATARAASVLARGLSPAPPGHDGPPRLRRCRAALPVPPRGGGRPLRDPGG